eukprot:c667_g1_i1 orf=58-1737(-)
MASLIYKGNLILLILVIYNPKTVLARWSASTIIDVAADLLEPSDDPSLQGNDPLVDSIENHHSTKGKHNVDGDERFMVPMLSNSVGDNNQLMEYMTAAVVARATKRTLCLTPFFNGPTKHTSQRPTGGLSMEERYDTKVLGKFVKVSSLQRCLQECNKQINGFWWLKHSSYSTLTRDWTWDPKNVETHDLGLAFTNWTSMDDIKQAVKGFNNGEERCVALGGMFPGLRWRGAYLAPTYYMRPSQSILSAATALQDLAIGHNRRFLAVHWRFEESLCQGEQLGLCFLRCGDGAVINSGLHAAARGWLATANYTMPLLPKQKREEGRNSCKRIVGSKGVMVSKKDLVVAIRDKASKENVSSVYLATDGWLRGSHAQSLVKEVVKDLRKQGLAVTGLWKIKELPNLITNASNIKYVDALLETTLRSTSSGHAISQVEQEICLRASAFMGSGESTWSLAVFRARLVRRRWQQLLLSRRANKERVGTTSGNPISDNLIIEELLRDSHAAGLQCRYQTLYKSAKLRGVVPEESYQDEAPDSWLDMEACEAQLSQGGSCKLLDCFP